MFGLMVNNNNYLLVYLF